MSVRHALLAILDLGPCYGYQLRAEFERRTGSARPLNVGQVYNTLERLERDGLVARDDVDAHGHVYWRISPDGSATVAEWLRSPVARGRDELALKVAIAATLPGVDVDAVIRDQRRASLDDLDALGASAQDARERGTTSAHDGPEQLASSIVREARVLATEAEIRWLDQTAQRLAQHPEHTLGLDLSAERPRRGRPSRAVSASS